MYLGKLCYVPMHFVATGFGQYMTNFILIDLQDYNQLLFYVSSNFGTGVREVT